MRGDGISRTVIRGGRGKSEWKDPDNSQKPERREKH